MIYLDNAATTPMLPCVRDAVQPWLNGEKFGNASALYTIGEQAKEAVDKARGDVAGLIGAEPSEIFFTSGGTESDNMALYGLISYLKSIGRKRVIVSAIEHHAVLNTLAVLEANGIKTEVMPVFESGEIDLNWLHDKLRKQKVGLVSVMLANNEIGIVQNLRAVSEYCHKYNCLVHTDAVQAVGHMPVDVKKLGVDMLSMSGHKFGAMQGVGALYIERNILPHFAPLIVGGGQENGLRSGTENASGIVSMGTAACHMSSMLDTYLEKYKILNHCFMEALRKEDVSISLLKDRGFVNDYLPNIISVTFHGVEAEALLGMMNLDGVCISAASACAARSLTPSHVLKAIRLNSFDARSTVRISLGVENTEEEMVQAARLLGKNVSRIRRIR